MAKNFPKKRRRSKPQLDSDGLPIRAETVAEFLRRGGRITKCPPKNAEMCIPGTTYIDGGVIITNLGPPEYVPNYVVSEQTYAAAQHDQPDVLIAHAWREAEVESLPVDLRNIATTRHPYSDESDDRILTDYFDEIEPEEAQQ